MNNTRTAAAAWLSAVLFVMASLQGCAVTPATRATSDPIPLDSTDPRYSTYLAQVRNMIKAKWSYPCVKDEATGKCEYKSAHLEVEFGIFNDGRLARVAVKQSSGMRVYDESALGAIRTASPFPPVPSELIALAAPGSTGIKILAKFNYVVETRRL